jgi:chromosome segregation ATPase
MSYYDEDGNPVEGVLSPEAAKELKEKADKLEEIQGQLDEKEKALEKLESKDMNFKRFKTLNQADREVEMANWSEEKKFYMQEVETLHNQNERLSEAVVGSVKERKIRQLVGEDKELRKELEKQYKILGDNALTPDAVANQLDDAFVLIENRKNRENQVDPLNSYVPSAEGRGYSKKKTNFADTDNGKALAKELGMVMESPKKD